MAAAQFISDLHLRQPGEALHGILQRFLAGAAREAPRLYVLGDLFEAWIGDDAGDPLGEALAAEFAALAEQGVALFFLPGNRDFLVGEDWCRRAGITPLPDPCVVELGGVSTLLSHGDRYCIDDTAYQAFRQQVRDPEWQRQFLALPVPARIAYARQAREQSAQHQQATSMELMDVNAAAIEQVLGLYGVERMIHGHTHRPARHLHAINGREVERWVIADWREHGETLVVADDGSVSRKPLV